MSNPVHNAVLWCSFIAMMMAATACGEAESPEEKEARLQSEAEARLVARVNGQPITEADFRASLEAQPSFVRQSIRGKTAYLRYFGDMISTVLLAQEARKRGFARDPDVATATRNALVKELWNEVNNDLDLTTVTNDAIQEYIQDHPQQTWQTEPGVRFEALFTRDPERARTLWIALSMAEGVNWPPDLDPTTWYRNIFHSWTEKEWPDLGPLSPGDAGLTVSPVLLETALSMDSTFVVSRPIKTERGYYLIAVTEQIPARPMTDQEKRAEARSQLIALRQQKAHQKTRRNLINAANVEILDPELAGALDKLPGK